MEISLFTKCLFEFIGTLVLVLLGDGVVASTVLKRSKGFDGGWIVITIAWGLAVMCGVLIAGPYSGAHLNPAVSVGLAVAGSFPWAYVPGYVAAQLLGGFCGAVVVYLYYKDHFDATDDPAAKLGVFCTMPAIMDKPRNLFCEVVGTFLLVFVILAIGNEQNTPEIGMGSLGSLPVTMLIMAIGMSLGGTTGYASHPGRFLKSVFQADADPPADLILRVAHRTAANGESVGDGRPRAESADVGLAVSHAAALVGHKRHDGLARQVAGGEERRHGRRYGRPPAGRADENHVVLRKVADGVFQRGAHPGFDLLFALVDHGPVFRGVGRRGNDLEQISARGLADLPRHLTGVAAVGEIGHQHFSGGLLRPGSRNGECRNRRQNKSLFHRSIHLHGFTPQK